MDKNIMETISDNQQTISDNGQSVFDSQQEETNTETIISNQKKSKGHIAAATIAKLAVLTALSWILYMFGKFNMPTIFPVFLEMQISDLPALLGGFAMGPLWGSLIIVFKRLLKMPFTSTACVGELADILIGISFVLPAALIYKRHKTKKGALIGIGVGIFSAVFAAMLANRFVLVPFYIQLFFDGNFDALIGMLTPLYANINATNFYNIYLWVGVMPFNLLRCVLCGGITFAVYKSVSRVLHR